MRVGLIGQVRQVWVPRGVKVRQPVELKYEWDKAPKPDGVSGAAASQETDGASRQY